MLKLLKNYLPANLSFVLCHILAIVRFIMKRAKRSKTERAFRQGYQQGVHGHPKENCPFQSLIDEREKWMSGWREGHAAYVAGYRLADNFL